MSTPASIPKSVEGWITRAQELGVQTTSMEYLAEVNPASMMTEIEFLTLRAIWPETISIDGPLPDFGKFSATSKEIKLKCDNFPGFAEYLRHIRKQSRTRSTTLGMFMMARDSQLRVPAKTSDNFIDSNSVNVLRRSNRIASLNPDQEAPIATDKHSARASASATGASTDLSIRTPAALQDPPINAKTKDEEIVNVALLDFLRAVTLSLGTEVECQWTPARAPFAKVKFGDNAFTARVDGYLEGKDDSEIFAIIEVKAGTRDRLNRPSVFWQETAEMVAWIMHDQGKGRHGHSYWLLSQDHNEIYLTQASFSQKYVKYLQGNRATRCSLNPNKDVFLHMQEYGPWFINSSTNMQSLAGLIVALTLDVTDKMR